MLFRMLRTQTSEHGTFRMGVAYDAGKDAGHIKAANTFIKAGLAEEVTAKQLDKEKAEAEKLAPVKAKKPALDVDAIKAAQEAADEAQKEADAAKAAEAAAKQEASDAKAEAVALAARVAELEALVADKAQG